MEAMERFRIRSRANEGIRLPLVAPDGATTDHWLLIRNQWSDAFREARDRAVQSAVDVAPGREPNRRAWQEESLLAVRSALVADWSFEEACTPEAVRAFLADAPQIAEQVDRVAADDAAFFGPASSSSSGGQKPS